MQHKQLSKHFSLGEFTKSQTASRLGIDNTPPDHVKKNLKLLAEAVLEPVRSHFGKPVRISSGYRSLPLNEAVGSKPSSQHIRGEAADFEIPGIPNLEVAIWISKHLQYDQVIWEYGSVKDPAAGCVHCSYKKEGNRNIVLTIMDNVTTKGLP